MNLVPISGTRATARAMLNPCIVGLAELIFPSVAPTHAMRISSPCRRNAEWISSISDATLFRCGSLVQVVHISDSNDRNSSRYFRPRLHDAVINLVVSSYQSPKAFLWPCLYLGLCVLEELVEGSGEPSHRDQPRSGACGKVGLPAPIALQCHATSKIGG